MAADRKKNFYERLYKINVLPDGNLNSINTIDVVKHKLEDPPFEDEEKEKGSI